MGLKRPVSDEETSPVKLNIDAEEALSLLSPVSKPVQFKRRLSKYQKVLSPGVTAYISNVVRCYVCNKTEAVWTRLDNTLDLIHDQLHKRLSQAFEKELEECLISSQKVLDERRKDLEMQKAEAARARAQAAFRSRFERRSKQPKTLHFAGARRLQPLPEPPA